MKNDVEPFLSEQAMVQNQQWLERAAAALFPKHCSLAVRRYDEASELFSSRDKPALKNAVPKRKREFSAGREAATVALSKIGIPNQPIPVGPARNPLWPTGIVGSIAHTAGLAIAVVAKKTEIAALGIDLESTDAVKPELWPSILTATEIAWVQAQPPAKQLGFATAIFCAKETFYKLQYPLTQQWLDFHDAEVVLTEQAGQFALTCTALTLRQYFYQTEFSGNYAIGDKFVATAMHLPQVSSR